VAGSAVYAATKAAVELFSKTLALELGPEGVRVNVVAPALVRSEIWQAAGLPQATADQMLKTRALDYALGRIGEPEDVAAAVSFLVSEQASWITGEVLGVNGGVGVNALRR
jgi:NAD(P)-dependent dehydrogenase (short-subunit alcohol dehydrogenase family)